MTSTRLSFTNKLLNKKLATAGIIAAMTAVVGTAGIAAALPSKSDDPSTKAIVDFCKQNYKYLGFRNIGDCVSTLEKKKHGYGGSTTATNNTNVNVNVGGHNNVVNIVSNVVNYVFNF